MPTPAQRDYYYRRSGEVRVLAKQARDPDIRTILEAMAVSYDTLVAESDRIGHMRTQLPTA